MNYNEKYIEKMMRHKKEYILGLLISALKREEKRTSLQNRALHLFFENMADQLNNIGLDCTIEVQGIIFTTIWTNEVFKTQIWKPLQKALFGIDSTTDLKTKMIDSILDVLAVSFSQNGIEVVFPNKFDLLLKRFNEINNKL